MGGFPSASLLGFPLAFAQTAHGTLQSWLPPSGAGPHSARTSVPISFPGGKQGWERTFLALLTTLIQSALRVEKG